MWIQTHITENIFTDILYSLDIPDFLYDDDA